MGLLMPKKRKTGIIIGDKNQKVLRKMRKQSPDRVLMTARIKWESLGICKYNRAMLTYWKIAERQGVTNYEEDNNY